MSAEKTLSRELKLNLLTKSRTLELQSPWTKSTSTSYLGTNNFTMVDCKPYIWARKNLGTFAVRNLNDLTGNDSDYLFYVYSMHVATKLS